MENLPVPAIGGEEFPASPALEHALHSARDYARAEKAAATRRAYRADFEDFARWCASIGRPALPATIETVAAYLGQLADSGRAASTISRRAAAIGYAHRLAGHEPPTSAEAVRATLRGIRRTLGTEPDRKAPVTAGILADMLAGIPRTSLAGLRDRALLLVGFGGALRRSELVALDVPDCRFAREGVLLHLARSKTDQEGAGALVPIPNGSRLRPVAALRDWLAQGAIEDGPVFRRIRRGGHVTADRLSAGAVALIVKRHVGPIGLDLDEFAGHSLRAGFVTEGLAHGADLLKVMDQARHKKVETTKVYDRRAKAFREHAGKGFL